MTLRIGLLFLLSLSAALPISCQRGEAGEAFSVPQEKPVMSGYLSDRSRNGIPVSKTQEDAQPIGQDTPVHADDSWTVVAEMTPCDVLRTAGDYAFVRVTSGDKAGTEGWVFKNQVIGGVERTNADE